MLVALEVLPEPLSLALSALVPSISPLLLHFLSSLPSPVFVFPFLTPLVNFLLLNLSSLLPSTHPPTTPYQPYVGSLTYT